MKAVLGAFSPVIAVDRKAVHSQIYDAYPAMIIGRNLVAGQQIPSTRTLASELAISQIPDARDLLSGIVAPSFAAATTNIHAAPSPRVVLAGVQE